MVSVSSDDGNPDMPLVGKLNLIDLADNFCIMDVKTGF